MLMTVQAAITCCQTLLFIDARQQAQGDPQHEIHRQIGGEAPDRQSAVQKHFKWPAGARRKMQYKSQPDGRRHIGDEYEQPEAGQFPINADQAAGPEATGHRYVAEPNAVTPPNTFLGAANGVQER